LQSQQGYLIVFDENDSVAPRAKAPPPAPHVTADAAREQIAQLKQELAATKEYLQSIIEALEASNEELQSANEEIQSGNEELQSTNEELQTSKEELESANEELNTVNEEMQHRNHQLTQLNNDLSNLLASINIPIVMLDADLNVRRYTPPAEELLGLAPTDLGRPIRRVPLKLTLAELEAMMLGVIRDVVPQQRDLEIWRYLVPAPGDALPDGGQQD
jgi:two-component system CheB/CheR fusion protein